MTYLDRPTWRLLTMNYGTEVFGDGLDSSPNHSTDLYIQIDMRLQSPGTSLPNSAHLPHHWTDLQGYRMGLRRVRRAISAHH